MPFKPLLLAGRVATLDDADVEGSLAYYAPLFRGLPRLVRPADTLSRFVGFQSRLDDSRATHFLGVEVDTLSDLPDDVEGWELDHDVLVRHLNRRAGAADAVDWLWRSAADHGHVVGEFRVNGGPVHHLTANAYFRPDGEGAEDDSVQLVESDSTWPEQYAQFASWLREALGPELALRIEHYGSTSIPGIPAKPVIDVLVEVPSFDVAKREALLLFNAPEWDYWWHGGHMLFVRRTRLMGARTHHVHLAPAGHRLWEGLIFRDRLRAHPDEAQAYADLKRRLAVAHAEDRERYTQAKSDFVARILEQAR